MNVEPDYVQVSAGKHDRSIELMLARPERNNAIDLDFARSLYRAALIVQQAVSAGEVDCVLVSARGRHFCVGGDLHDFPSDPEQAVPHLQAMSSLVHEALATLMELPVPIVAKVHGAAAGAGIGLACFADLVLASTAVRFRSAYTAVGLSPDCGVSWLLPRLIGERHAMEFVLTNRAIDAVEAASWGLISRAVEPDQLDAAVDGAVSAILAAGRDCLLASKRLLRTATTNGLRTHLADEGQTIAILGGSERALAAREAFLRPDGAVGTVQS